MKSVTLLGSPSSRGPLVALAADRPPGSETCVSCGSQPAAKDPGRLLHRHRADRPVVRRKDPTRVVGSRAHVRAGRPVRRGTPIPWSALSPSRRRAAGHRAGAARGSKRPGDVIWCAPSEKHGTAHETTAMTNIAVQEQLAGKRRLNGEGYRRARQAAIARGYAGARALALRWRDLRPDTFISTRFEDLASVAVPAASGGASRRQADDLGR